MSLGFVIGGEDFVEGLFDVPVLVDITHSLQKPNQPNGISGGNPEMIETIGRAAVANCCDGIFLETHPDPRNAKSDGDNMLPLDMAATLLDKLVKIHRVACEL